MEEGSQIAYQVLEQGVPVYASGGEQVGTVDHVVAAVHQDIFHGLVIRSGHARLFVPADQVADLHEFGVDLRIDAAQAGALEPPHGAAPALRASEPGVKPSRWSHLVDRLGGRDPQRRDWRED
jgi:sporulation protein YlmC with PRC-barrel domain